MKPPRSLALQTTADALLGAVLVLALYHFQAPGGVLVGAGVVIGVLVVRRAVRGHGRRVV
jgi:hypothetical protein